MLVHIEPQRRARRAFGRIKPDPDCRFEFLNRREVDPGRRQQQSEQDLALEMSRIASALAIEHCPQRRGVESGRPSSGNTRSNSRADRFGLDRQMDSGKQTQFVEQGTQVSRSPSRVRMAPGASDSKPLMLPLSGLFVDPVHRKSIDQCRRRIKTREQQLMTDEPAPRRRDSSFAVGVHHGPGGHVDDSTHR